MFIKVFVRLWIIVLIGATGNLFGCSTSEAQAERSDTGDSRTMNIAPTKVVELLSLKDEAYFALGENKTLALQNQFSAMFSNDPFSAPAPDALSADAILAIGAPKQVDIDKESTIPLLVASHQTGQRDWEVKYDQNAYVLVTHMHSGALFTGQPFIKGKRERKPEPSMSGNPPDPTNASATRTGVELIDLRKTVEISWRPGPVAVTVINYDRVSNTKMIELHSEKNPPDNLQPKPASDFVTSRNQASTQTNQSGIMFSIPNTVKQNDAMEATISINIPVEQAVLVKDNNTPVDPPLLMASMLLMQLDDRDPLQIDMVVPAKITESTSTKQKVVATEFALDVRRASAGRELSGTYQVYFVVGSIVYGPREVIVDQP